MFFLCLPASQPASDHPTAHQSPPPQPTLGWEGCQCPANPVLMRAWVQRGAAPEESRGPALSSSPLCPSSSPHGPHGRCPRTERDTGRGPRTTAARESETLHGLSLHLPAQGRGGVALAALWGWGAPWLPRCHFCVERAPCRNRALLALSLMLFAKPLHQRRPA